MTQSLIPSGKNPAMRTEQSATPMWICGEEFQGRPLNDSGAPRMELARLKDCGEEMLVIYNPTEKTFCDRYTCKEYTAEAIEVRIVDVR